MARIQQFHSIYISTFEMCKRMERGPWLKNAFMKSTTYDDTNSLLFRVKMKIKSIFGEIKTKSKSPMLLNQLQIWRLCFFKQQFSNSVALYPHLTANKIITINVSGFLCAIGMEWSVFLRLFVRNFIIILI